MLRLSSALFATALALTPTLGQAQEVTTTREALDLAMSLEEMPASGSLRIVEMKTTFSSRGNQWEITFRDGDTIYEVDVRQDGRTDIDRDIDDDGNVPEFWAAQPALDAVEMPEDFLQRASEVLAGLNETYSITGRAILEYEVCEPAEANAEYSNGCGDDTALTTWVVFAQVSANVRGEDQAFFKAVTFMDGLATEVTDANVFGNW